MVQLMLLPPHISCFIKIQIGLTFLVPAYPGCPGKQAVKRVSCKKQPWFNDQGKSQQYRYCQQDSEICQNMSHRIKVKTDEHDTYDM